MASENKKNIRKAHLLLGAYWLSRVFTTGNIPEATLSVLRIQRNSLEKEYRERHNTGAGGSKKAGLKAHKAGISVPALILIGKILKYIFKKERLF